MPTAKSIEELLKDPSKLKGGAAPTDDSQPTATVAPTDDKTTKPTTTDDESVTGLLSRKMKDISVGEKETKAKGEAEKHGFPYIDLIGFPVSPEAVVAISEDKSKKLKVLCFLMIGHELRVGAVNPELPAIKELAYQLGEQHNSKTEIYKISENSFDEVFKLYKKIPKRSKVVKGVEITQEELNNFAKIGKDFKKLNETIKKTNISQMVALMIAAALQSGSSDIHIEAEDEAVKVRLRVDGILHDAAEIDKKRWPRIVARFKLVAGLKINITEKPQDGRFTIVTKDDKIDVRVSMLPTSYGESIVMRILKSSAAGLDFDKLGLIGVAAKRLQEQIQRPNGMIITTGPTGSGKTTTLYSVLTMLNKEGTKIITLEDPIEYRLKGINQSQIDRSKGYSFADGLKSILRQDPDIVMVGELRDFETADVAINAALTGHLVLSTLHTNSAAGAIPRFMAMGIKGFLMAPALNAIIGQRLVRKVCDKCKEEYQPTEEEMKKVQELLDKIPDDHPDKPDTSNMKFYTGKGCDVCNNMKYKGRVGIYEILTMNDELKELVLSDKVSEYKILEVALKNHMLTMAQDGILKALKGITTLEEVFRVSE